MPFSPVFNFPRSKSPTPLPGQLYKKKIKTNVKKPPSESLVSNQKKEQTTSNLQTYAMKPFLRPRSPFKVNAVIKKSEKPMALEECLSPRQRNLG